MALVKCTKCGTQFYGVDCPSCGAKGSGRTVQQRPQTSPIVAFGCLFFLGIGVLIIYLLVTMPSKEPAASSRPSTPSPPKTVSAPSPRPETRLATAEETQRMNRAMRAARAKLDTVISTVGMSGDFVITHRASVTDGRATVNLDIDLISQEAKSAFTSRKLQNNTYPAFKRIYNDAMHDEGFSSASVYINTNPFKY